MTGIAPLVALLLAGAAPSAPDSGAPQRARPMQALPTLFTHRDYPREALARNEEGRVGFRLQVDRDGRPSGCSILSSSGSSLLDSTTCRLLVERARFTPARDAQGKPSPDSFVGGIVWSMGEASPRLGTLQALWSTCVMGEASKLAPGSLAAAEVARQAFGPCASLEELVAREVEDPAQMESARGSLGREVEQALAAIRTDLEPRAETGTPRD